MKKPIISKPSQVEQARQRLDQAVSRLESALKAGTDAAPPGAAGELRKIQAENEALRNVNQTVSGRLENTIGRLKSILES